jgi:hypothetical protein
MATFHLDHIQPKCADGETSADNLAYACPHCNGLKFAHTHAHDPVTGEVVPIFNPRSQTWNDHFRWSDMNPVVLEGKTACGRATIALLEMNDPDLLFIRGLLISVELFP